jgi:1-aminocyclopropane-1-carboxylate deaminase/D-cysteine desulfhydrase-like pyridoxal-dependent ACC family enzyme
MNLYSRDNGCSDMMHKKAWTQKEFVPMAMGGNCPVGVIGQAGGILELAEQIQAGTSPDPDRIYIPIGSGCTISGLILGVCLARARIEFKGFYVSRLQDCRL